MATKEYEGFTIKELGKLEKLAMNLLTIKPNEIIPPHWHKSKEKIYHALHGNCVVTLNGGLRKLRAGESLAIEPNTIHSIKSGAKGVQLLVCFSQPFKDVIWQNEEPKLLK